MPISMLENYERDYKLDMKNDNYGVLLFEAGWVELGNALKPYEHTGPIGKYLYCKKFEVIGQLAELTFTPAQVNNQIKDEMAIWIPTSFIKFVAASTDVNAKAIGFVQ